MPAEPVADALADETEGITLLRQPPAAPREVPRIPARPTAPAASAPAGEPDEGPEAAGYYQPTVASALPYEFPSTGSVRIVPTPGSGPGTRPTGAGAPAASRTAARRSGPAVPPAPAPSVTIRPAATATPPAAAGAGRTAPERATPDRSAPESAGRTVALAEPGTPAAPVARPARGDLFGRHFRSYAAESSGQQVAILQAGCTTAEDLGTDALRAAGARLNVGMVDEDSEVTRAAVAHHQSMGEAVLGDLRTVPLSPRAYDIVQCSSLLGRIEHAELVLDRLSGAVKPGGLLLLRIRDRDSAAGFLDRVLPEVARRAIWRKRQPGEPGPHAAVYERVASGRGIQAYVLAHGLVIAERAALGGLADGLSRGPHGYLTAQKLVARLSRGRLTPAHEDLLYVIRKPEDRFARII